MKFSLTAIALSLLAASASAEVTSLTVENFEEKTAGKVVFIKFFAPWCGHCKAMAADWEKLAEEWVGNDTALIAEVDCTAEESEELCETYEVEGFPTLKYGEPPFLEDYTSGRDFDEMSVFAKAFLKPSCSPRRLDLCDDEFKAAIEKIQAMSTEDLESAVADIDEKIEQEDEKRDQKIEELQETYEKLLEDYDEAVKALKVGSDYRTMTAVLAMKKEGSVNEEL